MREASPRKHVVQFLKMIHVTLTSGSTGTHVNARSPTATHTQKSDSDIALEPGMVGHICNPSSLEAEAGEVQRPAWAAEDFI